MNGSLTTLSLPVIGDWGLSNVFSFLNIVKQFLVLTCLVLCLRQPALHQYISYKGRRVSILIDLVL